MKQKMQLKFFYKCKLRLLPLLFSIIIVESMSAQVTGTSGASKKWLMIGASTTGKFSPTGINVGYGQAITNRIGINADAGMYFGKTGPTTLNKFQFLGGPSLLPSENSGQKISISPYVLAGITDLRTTVKFNDASFKSNQFGFSVAAGANISLPISNSSSLFFKADFNPTWINGCMQKDVRLGAGLKITLGKEKEKLPTTTTRDDVVTTEEKFVCHASKDKHKEEFKFEWLKKTIDLLESSMKMVPNIKAEFSVNPYLSVERGEECCSKDKPAAIYTELKGGVEAAAKVEFLWGPFPNVDLSATIGLMKLTGKLKCGIAFEPAIKFNIEPTGKFYGELGKNPRPDCKTCVYVDAKLALSGEVNIQAKLAVGVYFWHPFGKGKAGFNKEPDENFEISAKAGVNAKLEVRGRKVMAGDCVASTPWHIKIDPMKAFVKFKLELGPLSWQPSYEVPIFDSYEKDF
jgi:hypothetical protein